jgi:hypothetical protein
VAGTWAKPRVASQRKPNEFRIDFSRGELGQLLRGSEMSLQQNTDRIQTTHIGSLPRPHDVLDLLRAKIVFGYLFIRWNRIFYKSTEEYSQQLHEEANKKMEQMRA